MRWGGLKEILRKFEEEGLEKYLGRETRWGGFKWNTLYWEKLRFESWINYLKTIWDQKQNMLKL